MGLHATHRGSRGKWKWVHLCRPEFSHLRDCVQIQTRLANQCSITKLLHVGTLNGFNLQRGQTTLRKPGLNCVPFVCRADEIGLWIWNNHKPWVLFILLFSHWSVAPGNNHFVSQLQSCEEHFLLLNARIQFAFRMSKVFSYVGVDLWIWHCCINADTEAHWQLVPMLHVYVYVCVYTVYICDNEAKLLQCNHKSRVVGFCRHLCIMDPREKEQVKWGLNGD